MAPVSFRLVLTAGWEPLALGFLVRIKVRLDWIVSFSLREDLASRVVEGLGGVATRFPAGHWGLPPGWIFGFTC